MCNNNDDAANDKICISFVIHVSFRNVGSCGGKQLEVQVSVIKYHTKCLNCQQKL